MPLQMFFLKKTNLDKSLNTSTWSDSLELPKDQHSTNKNGRENTECSPAIIVVSHSKERQSLPLTLSRSSLPTLKKGNFLGLT